MSDWSAIVVARPEPDGGPMASRLPSFIHPVAGRPLVWHTVNSLARTAGRFASVVVVAPRAYPFDFLASAAIPSRVMGQDESDPPPPGLPDGRAALIHASAILDRHTLERFVRAEPGAWLAGFGDTASAILLEASEVRSAMSRESPFAISSGRLDPAARLPDTDETFLVRTRADLARAHQRIRDQLVQTLMAGGVTFILPESVTVDVDVRIGRDSIIYPGVVLEGQTNIGEETVVGPGCRIVDSWIGSGVELKGWNYIANTSVRNRAILEPYVRRGFS